MDASNYLYHLGELEFHGHLALPKQNSTPKPAVLVFHDWTGCNDFAHEKAERLADMGYVGFAADMYGNGRLGTSVDEKMALMQPLMGDRSLLLSRARAAYDAVIDLPEVDGDRVAAIGFCFGGLCALDLARSGVPSLLGAVSFHGLLQAPDFKNALNPSTKILALHGYDDPMVPPDQVKEFCAEMTQAEVDWQVHMYGNTKHAFSNPKANNKELGTIYNPVAEERSLQAMTNFLQSLF